MNLFDSQDIKNYLRASGLRPKDYFGQNFLIDEQVLGEIVQAAEISSKDTILEVGPGLGVLTTELVKQAKKVLAIEKDSKLIPLLESNLSGHKNLEIKNQDILKFNFEKELTESYKVVSNIPYYLTSHLFRILLNLKNKPQSIVFLVQKEVAERIVAAPGELSVLGISIQIFGEPEIISVVSKDSFWPTPKVDSAIIRIKTKNRFPKIEDHKLFFRIVKVAFAGKRKQIHNTLYNGFKIDKKLLEELLLKCGVSMTNRAQELSIEQWIKIYQELSKSKIDKSG